MLGPTHIFYMFHLNNRPLSLNLVEMNYNKAVSITKTSDWNGLNVTKSITTIETADIQ